MESEKSTKYTVRGAVMTARDRGNEREGEREKTTAAETEKCRESEREIARAMDSDESRKRERMREKMKMRGVRNQGMYQNESKS